jgi:hypothetical protein
MAGGVDDKVVIGSGSGQNDENIQHSSQHPTDRCISLGLGNFLFPRKSKS